MRFHSVPKRKNPLERLKEFSFYLKPENEKFDVLYLIIMNCICRFQSLGLDSNHSLTQKYVIHVSLNQTLLSYCMALNGSFRLLCSGDNKLRFRYFRMMQKKKDIISKEEKI